MESITDIAEVKVTYTYPNGTQGATLAKRDETDDALFSFAIPAEPDAGLGNHECHRCAPFRGQRPPADFPHASLSLA